MGRYLQKRWHEREWSFDSDFLSCLRTLVIPIGADSKNKPRRITNCLMIHSQLGLGEKSEFKRHYVRPEPNYLRFLSSVSSPG